MSAKEQNLRICSWDYNL